MTALDLVTSSAVPSTLSALRAPRPAGGSLVQQFEYGLDAPICLTWELTYACNLSCVHCLSSSGRRDPRELSTAQCESVIDELQAMQVFYVNIGGGEPTVRPDFWHLLDYAVDHQVGVKFSTNGVRITPDRARFLASSNYVDVQVSLDGATAEVNDHVRGVGSYAMARTALTNLAEAGFKDAKISVVVTRHNVGQLDDFKKLADDHEAFVETVRRALGRVEAEAAEYSPEAWLQLRLEMAVYNNDKAFLLGVGYKACVQRRHGLTEFVNVVGDHAPDDEVVFFFDEPGRVQGVFGHQLDHAASAVQTLDGELVVELGDDDAVVLGVDAAVHQQRIAFVDANAGHGVALDAEDVGGVFVANQLLVQVDALLRVVGRW